MECDDDDVTLFKSFCESLSSGKKPFNGQLEASEIGRQ